MNRDTLRSQLEETRTQLGEWTGVRDQLIRVAREQGWSLREIGDAAGLSHTAVANILNR